MIREATILDLPKIFEISKEVYNVSVNHRRVYAWNDEKALSSLKLFITSDESTLIIEECNGILKGFIIAELSMPAAGIDIIASDVVVFVKPEYQGGITIAKLIKGYETWAKSKGATHIELGVSSGLNHERTLSIYSRLGYRPSSVTYIKEI